MRVRADVDKDFSQEQVYRTVERVRRAGINVTRIRITAFIICSGMAAIGRSRPPAGGRRRSRSFSARTRGRGVIFLTSHLGAWEILCFAHSVFYDPLSFLVRPIDNPRIDKMIETLRTRFGNQPIDKKAAARAHRPDTATYGLSCRFVTGNRRRVDVDNLLKLVCDGLNGIAWLDDSQVWEVSCAREVDREAPRTEIVVYITEEDS